MFSTIPSIDFVISKLTSLRVLISHHLHLFLFPLLFKFSQFYKDTHIEDTCILFNTHNNMFTSSIIILYTMLGLYFRFKP